MKTYKHLVFDIDGTIIDSVKNHMVSLRKTLTELRGSSPTEEELRFSFGIPGVETMRILEFSDPWDAQKKWLKNYMDCTKELGMPLFPGMLEVLEKLKEAGVSLGIITSKERVEYDEHFKENGLAALFSNVVTSSDTPKGKPSPEPMLAYLKMTGASPSEVLYFGDTKYDMACARAAGVDQALVLWGCLNPEGIEASYRLEKVEDILGFAGL